MKKIFLTLFSILILHGFVDAQSLEEAFSKSYTYETSTNYTEAINVLKAVYNPKNYELNLRLGYLNYEAKKYAESVEYYTKSVDLMPFSIEAKLGLALPLSITNNWKRITELYADILKIDPQNSTVLYRMGLISYNNKEYNSAYKYYEKLVNMYPFSYDGLLMYAWTNYQLGKFADAKILFNKILLLSPGDKSAKEGLGLIK
jgi:tetratricopeptide (TPR) repeat protein